MEQGLLKNQSARQSNVPRKDRWRQTLTNPSLLDRTPSVHTSNDPTQLLDVLLNFIKILISLGFIKILILLGF